MEMSDLEILERFMQRAGSEKESVKILSELNGCSQKEIIEILTKEGVELHIKPDRRGRKKTMEEAQKEIEKMGSKVYREETQTLTAPILVIPAKIREYALGEMNVMQNRMDILQNQIETLEEEKKKLQFEYDEMDLFLSGVGA